MGQLEYGWWTTFQAVGQNSSQKKIGDNFVAVGMTYKRIPYAKVQAITQKNKLIILLREKSIVRYLHKTRPNSITFISQTRVGQPINLPYQLPIM